MKEFVIKVNEDQYGPFPIIEIKRLINRKAFSHKDLVWNENTNTWVSANLIEELNRLFTLPNRKHTDTDLKNKICAVASGKGGVGKTVISASLGIGLASMGNAVILVDADLGNANLHTCMGILDPEYTFFDFYTHKRDTLSDILIETPVENLHLISGACGTLGIANIIYSQKQKFIRHLKKLSADYILIDIGAGSSYNEIDFFLLADDKIIIVTPELTSVHAAFNFIKVSLLRLVRRTLKDHPKALDILKKEEINRPNHIKLSAEDLYCEIKKVDSEASSIFYNVVDSFRPKLILNMVRDREQVKEGMAIQAAAMELLWTKVDYLGYISFDSQVSAAVNSLKPFLLYNPKSQASQDLAALIRVKILGKKGIIELLERSQWRKQIKHFAKTYPNTNIYEHAPICSPKCFHWGDCGFQDEGKPCRVRHLEPRLK